MKSWFFNKFLHQKTVHKKRQEIYFYRLFFMFFIFFLEVTSLAEQPQECWIGDRKTKEQLWLIKALDLNPMKDPVIKLWKNYRQRQKSTEGQYCVECEYASQKKNSTGLEKIMIPSQNQSRPYQDQEVVSFFDRIVQMTKNLFPGQAKQKNVRPPVQERYPEVGKSIHPICIAASLRRETGSRDWQCNHANDKPKEMNHANDKLTKKTHLPCFRREEVYYISWLTNSAIQCINSLNRHSSLNSLKPEIVFGLINDESAFRFFTGSKSSGFGIMQLTSIGKEEVLPQDPSNKDKNKRKKMLQPSPLVHAIQDSTIPSCAPFKMALKTLQKSKHLTSDTHSCQFLSPGTGFANSLILSLALYLEYRGSAPILKNQHQEEIGNLSKQLRYSTISYLQKNQHTKTLPLPLQIELSQFLGMHAFSRYGPFTIEKLIQNLKLPSYPIKNGSEGYLKIFTERFLSHSVYAGEIQSKMQEVKKNISVAADFFRTQEKNADQFLSSTGFANSSAKPNPKAPLIDSEIKEKCFANVPSPSP